MRRPAYKSKPAPAATSTPTVDRARFPVWLIAGMLVLVTITLYWPATRYEFINFDDDDYVTANPHVQRGLNWEAVKWAFSNTQQAAYWAPLMWVSHIVAWQCFGPDPWGHHLLNVLLHAVNTGLVFLLFRGLTGAPWRSALVAALFGLHPLRLESVVWVTERKDVLSGLFGLLALISYGRFVRKRLAAERQESTGRGVSRGVLRSAAFEYGLSLLFFALGLMSKAVLVTWPFVLLLLDYWPLRRWERSTATRQRATLGRLLAEKFPFLVLGAAASVVTFVVQARAGALTAVENLPLAARVGNALISYCRYLGKLFWPTDLAIFYPHPGSWPLGMVLLAGAVLLGISAFFHVKGRRCPFLLVGWLWFVGVLVPNIGLVQAGHVALADRFTYLPSLGVLIITIWSVYELARGWHYRDQALGGGGFCGNHVLCGVDAAAAWALARQ